MCAFFEDDNLINNDCSSSYIDRGALRSHLDRGNRDEDSAQRQLLEVVESEKDANGGASNDYYLNDYRNRMPFHYAEDGSDGYYYWLYGATMTIELIFEDLAVAVTDDTLAQVLGVKYNGKSIVDSQGVANILTGTMAQQEADNYYTKKQSDEKTTALWNSLNAKTSEVKNKLTQLDIKVKQSVQSTVFNLPPQGVEKILYVTPTDASIRVWDKDTSKFIRVGSDYEEIDVICGGSASS